LAYREPGTKDQGLGVFARVMGAPGDRNLVNFYADAGVTYKGLIPGRDSDTAGLAFGLARISDTAAKLDADTARFTGGFYPVRRHESVLELTYQAQIAPWWQVQPTAQYVFNPNGGVPNPQRPEKRLGDAAVLGLRTTVTF
jgi:porin